MSIRHLAGHLVDRALDVTIAPGYTTLGLAARRRLPGWPADPPRLDGAHVLVTGTSSGLGSATAAGLARLGAHVHLVVRDADKGRRVAGDLGIEGSSTVWSCDVSDLEDVERLAGELTSALERDGRTLSGLIHNAGSMPPRRTESAQGHELTMALHVLGPVLLTERLLPVLDHARIVLVTSGGMYAQRLRADDPDFRRGAYSPTTAYARSKRAQVELLPLLQQRWGAHGHAVAATHPGWADTPGVADSLPTFRTVVGPLLRDADDGADTTIWLAATRPAPEGGRLWHDRQPRPTTWLGRNATSPAERDRLWAWVTASIGVDG